MGLETQKNKDYENKEEKTVIEKLKEESLNLSHIAFTPSYEQIPNMEPGTWNENDGVIIFGDKEGRPCATPSSEWAHDLLFNDETMTMKKDENIGVPHLNLKETWGDEKRRDSMSGFKQWEDLSGKRLHPLPETVFEPEQKNQ